MLQHTMKPESIWFVDHLTLLYQQQI